jgi:steroid 5-alpha reductase family enzyme
VSGTDLAAWAIGLSVTAATSLVLFGAAFVVGVVTGRHRVVDVVWGLAFTAVAVVSFALSAGHGDTARRTLALVLTAVWGLRLAVHIAARSRGKPEDPRYEALLAKARGSRAWFAFTRVYLLQALLVWFISLPIQIAAFGTAPLGPQTAVACVLWLVGVSFETVGDWQLERFRADPAHRGKLMTSGLWRYTRHPNYFGDACVWWGLFLLAADQRAGLCTIASPILMTVLLTVGSGMRLADRHMAGTRPEFADYARRTSGFIPLPPRRASSGRHASSVDRGTRAG